MPNLPKPRLRRAGRRGELVSRGAAALSRRRRTSSRSTPPACAGSTSSARRRSSAPGSRSTSTSTPSTSRTSLSRNQRPKIDVYADYLFIVLHFPVFDPAVGPAGHRRARHLRRPRLPGHDPEPAAAAGRVPVRALPREGGAARAALLARLRLPALPARRRQLRLLLPDAAQDRQQARRARGRHLRGALGGGRARHLQRQAGDHQLPQGDPPAAARSCATSRRSSSATSPPTSTSRSTSTTSSTPTSGSGTCSRTTRRWSRRSRRPTSR